ncbi:MAG: hypothetical protein VW268_04420 [Rhodospirillaceae bacterium]
MQLKVSKTVDDGYGRTYMELANPAQAQEVYEHQRAYWQTRNLPNDGVFPEDYKAQVISQQTQDYSQPSHATLRVLLDSLVDEKTRAGGSDMSIIEIGVANGPTLRHFKKFYPDVNLSFVGFEALSFLAEDAQTNYPEQKINIGTVETFLESTTADLGRDRFDVFLTSLVLCMTIPDVVYPVFRRASEMSDVILCRDYLVNKGGEISKDRPVLFKMAEGHDHFVFANPFELMLRSLGFSRIEYIFDEIAYSQIRGMGTLLARGTR